MLVFIGGAARTGKGILARRLVAERMWPLVREMSASLLREGVNYCIEGELLPQHVGALQQ
jgi:hypothetical protein